MRFTLLRSQLLTGNPRLLVATLPWVLAIAGVKILLQTLGLQPLDFSPLLTTGIAAEVFVVGFVLNGTAADFKEAEHLPGQLAASLETIADQCLVLHQRYAVSDARDGLAQLCRIGSSVERWLLDARAYPLDQLMAELRELNAIFARTGETTHEPIMRLQTEQASIRATVLRMDTMRRTSYVAAGYLIGEVVAIALLVVLLVTDIGPLAPTLALVGLVSYLLIYLVALIRDLDNPFEYVDGKPGAADVDLTVLRLGVARLEAIAAGLNRA